MRIALITHHWLPNFGANLQALATFSYLKQHHDVEVLHYVPPFLVDRYRRIVSQNQFDEHMRFCERFLRLSPLLRDEDEIERYCYEQQFETIIAGSDAIFRLSKHFDTCEGDFPNPFWLGWAKRRGDYIPRTGFISGSATGSSYYSFPGPLKRRICEELGKADYISVRDTWTRWMFQLISGGRIRAPICPDPVSILNTVFEIPPDLEREPRSRTRPYILYSGRPDRVPRSWLRQFVDLCHAQGYAVYGLPMPEYDMPRVFDRCIRLPLSPVEWYGWIRHAAGFVGERFHPTVCSLFNRVPF
ncbi:MAG: hypothetical protein GF331_23965, partial [Chitinivibrionales bacterium]|nr:hypothetical protein [Chitinivibrionales bacterium]